MTLQSYVNLLCIISIICNIFTFINRDNVLHKLGLYGSCLLSLILGLVNIIHLNHPITGLIWMIACLIWIFNVSIYQEDQRLKKY